MIILRARHKVYPPCLDEFAFHWGKLCISSEKGVYNWCSNYNPKNFFANLFCYSINLVDV